MSSLGLLPTPLATLRADMEQQLNAYQGDVQTKTKIETCQAALDALARIPDYTDETVPEKMAWNLPEELSTPFGMPAAKVEKLNTQFRTIDGYNAARAKHREEVVQAADELDRLERILRREVPAIADMVEEKPVERDYSLDEDEETSDRSVEMEFDVKKGTLLDQIRQEFMEHKELYAFRSFGEVWTAFYDLVEKRTPTAVKLLCDQLAELGELTKTSMQSPLKWKPIRQGLIGTQSPVKADTITTTLPEKGDQLLALLGGVDVEEVTKQIEAARRKAATKFDETDVTASLKQLTADIATTRDAITAFQPERDQNKACPAPTRGNLLDARRAARSAARWSCGFKILAFASLIAGGGIVALRNAKFHEWLNQVRPLPAQLDSIKPQLKLAYTEATKFAQNLTPKQLYAGVGGYAALLTLTYRQHVQQITWQRREIVEAEKFVQMDRIFNHESHARYTSEGELREAVSRLA